MMTPEEFGEALNKLLETSQTIVQLPLDGMLDYIEEVELKGADNPNYTSERQYNVRFVKRLVAASAHVVAAARLGGT